jgi:hypothetical protein
VVIAAVTITAASAMAAGGMPAQAASAPTVVPVALDTCRNPGNAFVSLEVAPEVPGRVPIGAGYHRLWDMAVAWKDVNPAPGVFTWATLDQRVAQAEASGAIPMLVLGLTPQWAAADPSAGDPRWGAGTASPPANMNTFQSYVDAVVSRYGPRIGAYEVWNEANLPTFWTGTPVQMANMTQIAYYTIKDKNPGAIVTAASVTTRLRGPMKKFVTPYVKALASAGSPIDAFAIHSYPAGTAGPAQRVLDVQHWQTVVEFAAGPGADILDKQVWDTEVNYGLAGPGSTPGTDYTDAQGADLITQTFADSLELGIDATFWYLYTAAPFDLLGVQLWSGTPASIAAWNTARSTYSAGTGLCSGVSAPGEITDIEGECKGKGSECRVVITGTSTGLAGRSFIVYLRVGSGSRATFTPVGIGSISSDGSFRYTYRPGSFTRSTKAAGYITVGSITSETVRIYRD